MAIIMLLWFRKGWLVQWCVVGVLITGSVYSPDTLAKTVNLTAEKPVVVESITAWDKITSTLSASRDFDPKTSNRIFSIACVSAASYEMVPRVMQLISQVAPNIALEVHPLFTEDYESDLRLQRHDVIIDMTPRGRTTLKHEVVSTEELVVVCRSDHPVISDTINMEQFLTLDHVVVSRWHARKSLLSSEHFSDLEKRRVVYRAAGVVEMLPVIEGSDAIGMLPMSSVRCFAEKYNVRTLPLPFDLEDLDMCMIWHPSRTNEPSHKWLRAKIKAAAKDTSTKP